MSPPRERLKKIPAADSATAKIDTQRTAASARCRGQAGSQREADEQKGGEFVGVTDGPGRPFSESALGGGDRRRSSAAMIAPTTIAASTSTRSRRVRIAV